MKKETAKKIVKAYADATGVTFEQYIASVIGGTLDLQSELVNCNKAIIVLQEKYDRDKAALESRKNEIVKKCPHLQLTYHPDPSGNNDSWYSCDVCNAEARGTKKGLFFNVLNLK
jgi:hypothetical protein